MTIVRLPAPTSLTEPGENLSPGETGHLLRFVYDLAVMFIHDVEPASTRLATKE